MKSFNEIYQLQEREFFKQLGREIADAGVSALQSIPLSDPGYRNSLRGKRDEFVRDYYMKHYPDQAKEFYAKQDAEEMEKIAARKLADREAAEAKNPSLKQRRLKQEAVKAIIEKSDGYKGYKSRPAQWKAYLDEVAVNDKEFMAFFKGPKSMKRYVLEYLKDESRISYDMYRNLNKTLDEGPDLMPKRSSSKKDPKSELFESIYVN